MNRYLSLTTNEIPGYTIHEWLIGLEVHSAGALIEEIIASCVVDGVMWVKVERKTHFDGISRDPNPYWCPLGFNERISKIVRP